LQFIGIPGRNYGVFSHPNQLGQAAAILFIFYLFADQKKYWLLLPIFCLIKCGSRTSILASVLGLTVYVLINFTKNKYKKPRKKLQLGLVVGTLIGFLLMALISQFIILIPNLNSDSLTGRVQIWQTSLELFKNSSFIGLGLGWEQRAIDAQLLNIWAVSSHNQILEVMFSSGILGLIAFLFLPIKAVVNFSNLTSFEKAFLIATLISSISEAYLDLQYPTLQTYLMLAIIVCSDSKRDYEQKQ
jgi:O-antigen ligase